MNYLIVSATRGVYCGNNQFHRDKHLPVQASKVQYPTWSQGRVELMMQDIKDSGGPDDLRSVYVVPPKNTRGVGWDALIQKGLVTPEECGAIPLTPAARPILLPG